MPSSAFFLLFTLVISASGQTNDDKVIVNSSTAGRNANCPGVLQQTNNKGYCCVGGDLNLSTCEGWPLCIGPQTAPPDTTSMSCATKIPITASDYSSLIESASSKYLRDRSGTEPSSTRGRPMPAATSTEDSNDKVERTASRASPSETGSGSNMTKSPSLVGGLLGGILALLCQVFLAI